jgi:hypothetical protein
MCKDRVIEEIQAGTAHVVACLPGSRMEEDVMSEGEIYLCFGLLVLAIL